MQSNGMNTSTRVLKDFSSLKQESRRSLRPSFDIELQQLAVACKFSCPGGFGVLLKPLWLVDDSFPY